MAAGETQAQMNPGGAQGQTFLAALRRPHSNRPNPGQVRIRNSRNHHVGSYISLAMKRALPRRSGFGPSHRKPLLNWQPLVLIHRETCNRASAQAAQSDTGGDQKYSEENCE